MKLSHALPLRFNIITMIKMHIGADGFSSALLEHNLLTLAEIFHLQKLFHKG